MEIFLLLCDLGSCEGSVNSCQLCKIRMRKLILMEILLPVPPTNGGLQTMLSNTR